MAASRPREGRVCIFWTLYRNSEVREWKWSELRRGRLRQGWGGPGQQLVEGGKEVPREEWLERFKHNVRTSWPPEKVQEGLDKAEARLGILSRMLRLGPGDLVVVPHLPKDRQFTMALASGSYRWDDAHFSTPPGWKDFGHVIPVDPASLVTWDFDSSVESRELASRFRKYRAAVTFVRRPDYAEIAWRLFRKDGLHHL